MNLRSLLESVRENFSLFLFILVDIIVSGILISVAIQPYIDQIVATFSSLQALQRFIESFGIWAPIIFILLQIAQVIIAIIPGNIITLMGGALFGSLTGSVLSIIGTLLGSLLAFYLARCYGQAIVIKLVGQCNFENYSNMFTHKLSLPLLLLFLVPIFPNDILCFMAGLSGITLRRFCFFLFLGRLPNVLITALLGSSIFLLDFWQWLAFGTIFLLISAAGFFYATKTSTTPTQNHL